LASKTTLSAKNLEAGSRAIGRAADRDQQCDAPTRVRLLAQSALWRNVYVAASHSQAEDELSALLLQTRAHMMHVRAAYNPPDFTIDPAMLNPWADPEMSDAEAIKYVLATGSLFGRRGCTSRSPNCAMSASVTSYVRPDSAT
jgi:hypothetical protein